METIADGGTRVVVDSLGALIVSVLDERGVDLLAEGNPTRPELRAAGDLTATGFRGWIECFPTIDAEPDAVNGRADRLGGHGELWPRRWTIERRTPDSMDLSLELEALGVSCTRSIRVGPGRVMITSTIANRSDRPFAFVWASHPLLAADPETWIELADSPIAAWGEGDRVPATLDELWPGVDGRRRWRDLPDGFARKIFAPWPEGGVEFSVGGRTRRIRFAREGFDGDIHLGLWLNRRGFPADAPLEHFAIEPTIGSTDSLTESARRGTAGELPPAATVTFETSVTL